MSATHFSLLSYDVLLHLVKFVEPVDCVNLLLSGILEGFENVSKGIDLQKRIEDCAIVFGPSSSSIYKLDVRSCNITDKPNSWYSSESSIIPRLIFERLLEGGFLTNNRRLSVICDWSHIPQYCQDICSMKKLESLKLKCVLRLKQLVPLFGSCPKLVELDLELIVCEKLDIDEQQKNILVQGFQRLKHLRFQSLIDNDSWPVIREMLTWLRECRHLSVCQENPIDSNRNLSLRHLSVCQENHIYSNPIDVTGGSSTLDPISAPSLQSLFLEDTPDEFVEWILPACSNIHTLHIDQMDERIDACIKLGSLKKLRELYVEGRKASHFKEIFRNCHQVEIFRLSVVKAKLEDFAEFNATNMKEVELLWEKGPSIEEVLLVLVKCRQLRKLRFYVGKELGPTFEVLSYFIKEMNHLEYLFLYINSNPQLKHLGDKIRESILPSRPNFKFEVMVWS